MLLSIHRYAYLPFVTLGVAVCGDLRLQTLEEGWRSDPDGPGGQARAGSLVESCIPDGEYSLVPHSGSRFRNVWAAVNPSLGVYRWPADRPSGQAWGRSAILIHSGNTTEDIEGCILVGLGISHAGPQPRLVDSALAVAALRKALGPGDHDLEIRPAGGTAQLVRGGVPR